MHIVELTGTNIKRLKAVRINPDGSTVIIGGRNAQGKTSVLDVISMGLEGEGAIPPEPIRRGQDEAEIELKFNTGLRVNRSFKGKKSSLTVKAKDGAEYRSPQTLLKALVNKLFDPFEFTRMTPKEQLAMLKTLVGLDFSELDAERAKLYAQRTDTNKRVVSMRADVERMAQHADAPDEKISIAGLAGELEQVNASNAANANKRQELRRHHDGFKAMESERDSAHAVAANLEIQLSAAKDKLAALTDDVKSEHEKYSKRRDAVEQLADVDTGLIVQILNAAEETNDNVDANAARKNAIDAGKIKAAESEDLTKRIEAIDASKNSQLSKAEFPIDGLSFGDGGVVYNDLPFEQSSSAEQLRVSVAMGLALNPELKVLLIRDGSLLDADGLRMIAELADKMGGQVWIERVGDGDECTVIIEDGEIVGHVREPEAAAD